MNDLGKQILNGLSKASLIFLLTLTVIGTGLRLNNLGGPGLWWDEMMTLLMASGNAQSQLGAVRPYQETQVDVLVANANRLHEMVATKPAFSPVGVLQDIYKYEPSHPPLYYLLGNLSLSLFGYSEFAIRLPTALAGGLTIPFLFLLGRRLSNQKVGLIAAGLFALAPVPVYYGQEAKMYSLLMLSGVVSTWMLIDLSFGWREATKEAHWPKWFAYSLMTAMGLYTQYLYVCMLAVHFLFVAMSHFRDRIFLGRWITSMGLVFVCYLPWLLVLLLRAGEVPSGPTFPLSWHGTGPPVFKLIRSTIEGALKFVWASELRPHKIVWLWISLISIGLLTVHRRSGLWLIPLWAAIPLATVVIFDIAHGTNNSRVIRYYLLSAPAIYLLVSLGIDYIRPRKLSQLVAGAVLIYLAVGGYLTTEGKINKRIETKEAGRWISEVYQPADTVVVVTSYQNVIRAINLAYYASGPEKITTIKADNFGKVDLSCFALQSQPSNHIIVIAVLLKAITSKQFDPSSVLGGKRVLEFMDSRSFRELSVFRYRIQKPKVECIAGTT